MKQPPPGWQRIDPRPWWTKTSARWHGPRGWTLAHCGHPTAHWPWLLRNRKGAIVLTGAMHDSPDWRPDYGVCWPTLEAVFAFVASERSREVEEMLPGHDGRAIRGVA